MEMNEYLINVSLDKIIVNQEDNPRKELENSRSNLELLEINIAANGLLNPIVVEKISEDQYKLIAGYRRFKAYENLNKKSKFESNVTEKYNEIYAHVYENVSDQVFVALSENLARKDMTEDEKARAIYLYKNDTEESVREIAYKLGISKSYVDKLYQRGKKLTNSSEEPAREDKVEEFQPSVFVNRLNDIKEVVELCEEWNGFSVKEKIDIKEKARAMEGALQQALSYLKETQRAIRKDSEVQKFVMQERKRSKKDNV